MKFLFSLATLVFFLVHALVCELRGEEFLVVDEGRPQAVIVLPEPAAPVQRRAALELQETILAMTGVQLSIRTQRDPELPGAIYLGFAPDEGGLETLAGDLASDGFVIEVTPKWMAIVGRDHDGPPIHGLRNPWLPHEVYNSELQLGAFGEAGTLHGVYHWLEEFAGVRWYWPGDLGRVLSPVDTLGAPLGRWTREPDFVYRFPWLCNFEEAPEEALWYRRVGFGAPYPAQIIDSFAFFMEYHDSHPGYFALIDGERDVGHRSTVAGGGNLCLSNPEVVKRWVEIISEYFDQHPEQWIYPLAPNDGMARVCECPECQSQLQADAPSGGRFSDYVWSFVNEVATGVGRIHPDKFVGCLAYEQYRSPPIGFHDLEPNVAVMYCKERALYNVPGNRSMVEEEIVGWSERAGRLYVWEYYLQPWPPWTGFPVFFPNFIAEDLRFLRGRALGEFIEAESWIKEPGRSPRMLYPGMQHLNLYLTAKLLWDADLDVQALLDEYFEGFYGAAAGPMKQFWETAAGIWEESDHVDSPVNMYTPDDLALLGGLLDEAARVAPQPGVEHDRIAVVANEFFPAFERVDPRQAAPGRELGLRRIQQPVCLDGRLSDETWRTIPPGVFVNAQGRFSGRPTLVYGAWDEEALYLGFLCYRAQETAQASDDWKEWFAMGDAPDSPDSIELFFAPHHEGEESGWRVRVYSNGTVSVSGSEEDPQNAGIKVKTADSGFRWSMECRIPWEILGVTSPNTGQSFPANLFRAGDSPAEESGWSPPDRGEPASREPTGFFTLEDG